MLIVFLFIDPNLSADELDLSIDLEGHGVALARLQETGNDEHPTQTWNRISFVQLSADDIGTKLDRLYIVHVSPADQSPAHRKNFDVVVLRKVVVCTTHVVQTHLAVSF